MHLAVKGHPLHSRALSVTLTQGQDGTFDVTAHLLDLRKRGVVPVAGDLQPAGVIHHMQLSVVVDPRTRTLRLISAAQPAVAFEASATTEGESCRDPIGRVVALDGVPLGLGNVAKLVNSLMAFAATWISLEGLAVACKSGIDLRDMIEVIRTGGAGNVFTDRMVEGINERGRPTSFSLSLAAKDAGLLLDVARETGVPIPAAAQVAQAFVAAIACGLGERDFTDLVEVIERQADVRLALRAKETS